MGQLQWPGTEKTMMLVSKTPPSVARRQSGAKGIASLPPTLSKQELAAIASVEKFKDSSLFVPRCALPHWPETSDLDNDIDPIFADANFRGVDCAALEPSRRLATQFLRALRKLHPEFLAKTISPRRKLVTRRARTKGYAPIRLPQSSGSTRCRHSTAD